ncbi:hypothetical protein C1H46_014420 [Malus baccata]|uniref:Uncharacterized protein n=1 Tax=Malus baccata TaxID=106549 RepID=A0A540MM75_MALBA|nr:hypothetical protein C1H46_014420 [Malus baccata]
MHSPLPHVTHSQPLNLSLFYISFSLKLFHFIYTHREQCCREQRRKAGRKAECMNKSKGSCLLSCKGVSQYTCNLSSEDF